MSEDILTRLQRADSAEAFFTTLGVDYEPQVLHVARLHILRRMGQYLATENFAGEPETVVEARCRDTLSRAYADFTTSTPLEQRVFKVLRDAVKPAPKTKTLVQIGGLD